MLLWLLLLLLLRILSKYTFRRYCIIRRSLSLFPFCSSISSTLRWHCMQTCRLFYSSLRLLYLSSNCEFMNCLYVALFAFIILCVSRNFNRIHWNAFLCVFLFASHVINAESRQNEMKITTTTNHQATSWIQLAYVSFTSNWTILFSHPSAIVLL